jgi:hypothetical protein
VDQFPDFDPRKHYALTIAETETLCVRIVVVSRREGVCEPEGAKVEGR